MARPSDYSPEMADKICEMLIKPMTLSAICDLDEFPDDSTVYRWLDKHEEFRDKYARARERQADKYAEEIVSISDEQAVCYTDKGTAFDPDVNRDRLRIDARKWFASKVAPKKYGDRQEITHGGSIGLSQMTDAELEQRARGEVK